MSDLMTLTTAAVNDPIADEVFRHLFAAIAEEMGVTLERTAFSPNIKERRDHSCAVFDSRGRLIAQAAHIPVHLGAFPLLMQAVVPRFDWQPGDVVICNDPFVGGTHLPDISVVSPVFSEEGMLEGFVANRAHHADVGGAFPGSMGATTEVFQEGIIIPPVKLLDAGVLNSSLLELVCRNVRTPEERRGDLNAQLGANSTGIRRFAEVLARYGPEELRLRARLARQATAAAVRELVGRLPAGRFDFVDQLDDDGWGSGPVPIRVSIEASGGRLLVDFSGTAPQQRGSINATLAVTHAAVYYALACLLPPGIALNEGAFTPIDICVPEATVIHARPPAAVAAGNVETSQRIVDVLFGALAQALPEVMPAASQGTMNNVTLGGAVPAPWAYYETMGGGSGAGPEAHGTDAIHCHMSNTRNTPAEALEYHYPLRVREYGIRDGSSGAGRQHGGRGLVREVELLAPATLTLLTDRRESCPYGLAGGASGVHGVNEVLQAGEWAVLPHKGTVELPVGAVFRIATPGGGGWGTAEVLE